MATDASLASLSSAKRLWSASSCSRERRGDEYCPKTDLRFSGVVRSGRKSPARRKYLFCMVSCFCVVDNAYTILLSIDCQNLADELLNLVVALGGIET